MLLGNFHFFLNGIPRDIDNFHPVQKGRLNWGKVIGSSDEHYLGKVKSHLQEVIVELAVLFRIQDLQ